MAGDGTITRKEIITDDSFTWGPEYAKQLKIADDANNQFKIGLKETYKILNDIRGVKSSSELIDQKNKEVLANQKVINSLKQLELAETSMEKVKKLQIENSKKQIDTDSQQEKLNQQKIKTQKEQTVLEQQLNKLSIEKEKLQKEGLNTNKALIQSLIQEEKLKKEQLDVKSKELRIINQEEAAKKRNTKLTIEERIQNEINNRTLKQAALDKLGLVGAYAKLNAARTQAKRTLLDLLAAENQDTKAIKEATKAFEDLDKRVRSADKAVGDFTKNVGNYPTFKGLAGNLRDLAGAFGLVGGIQTFANILGDAYKTIKEFEQSLADLQSITGASGKDLDFLKNSAIDLGQKVEGGAKAVVEAYKLIAGAKPELLDNVQALNAVTEAAITLSQAAGMELPEAATALTDAMNQFGADASRAQEFIDALANGAKFGSAEIPQLTEALLKFGAVARSSNVSIQESAALVELLAENGLKGAEAGTALRNILLKISAPDALPKTAVKELNRLGVSMETLRDSSIPVQQRLEALKPLLKDNASIVKVFGVENATSAINVLSHTDRLKELTGQMGEFGTAEEQAKIRMDTLTGKTEVLKSTYDSFILSIGNGSGTITDFFKFFIDGATGALQSLIRLNTSWDELYAKSKQQGSAQGAKDFTTRLSFAMSFGSKDEEGQLESIRKAAFNQRKVLYEEYVKNQKALKNFNPYALNFSGVSGKDLKKRKEELLRAIALEEEVINQATARQSALKNPKKPEEKTNNATLTGPTDKEIKDRLKALKALSDAAFNLKKEELERNIKINQEITDDVELNDDIRIASAENVKDANFELIELTRQNQLDQDKFVLANEKLNADQKILIQYQSLSKQVDAVRKTEADIKKIREFSFKEYEDDLKRGTSLVSISNDNAIAEENRRFELLRKAGFKNQKEAEKAAEKHEQNLFNIKKAGAIAQLKIQLGTVEDTLNDYEAQSDGSKKSQDLILAKRAEIAKLSKEITEAEAQFFIKKEGEKELTAREKAEQILDISSKLTDALNSIANALFEGNIQNIEVEIDKNNEKYDKLIEAAEGNEKQQDLLEKERDKKNDQLEEKKKKEQRKQAVANKAAAIAQAAISTALAVIQAYAQLGPIGGTFGAVLVAAVGAIQIAAIAATPIPKYKTGRKGGKKETAIVGDGGVSEVIERRNGKVELTPSRDTLVELGSGDNVYKDIEDYKRNGRMSVMKSLDVEGKKVNEYFNITLDRDRYGKEIVTELKEVVKSVKRIKLKHSQQKPSDLNHELWKYKNIKS